MTPLPPDALDLSSTAWGRTTGAVPATDAPPPHDPDGARAVGRALEGHRSVVVHGGGGWGMTSMAVAGARAAGATVVRAASLPVPGHDPLDVLVGDLGAVPPEAAGAALADSLGSAVLVADDLQWAPASTLERLAALASRVPVVAVHRSGPEAVALTAALGTDPLVLQPRLLDDDRARSLVRGANHLLADDLVDEVVRRAGGVPLVLRSLAGASGGVPGTLADRVDHELGSLDVDERVALWLVAATRGQRPADLDPDAARSLIDRALVLPADDGLVVAHDVLAERALAGQDPEVWRAANRAAAEVVTDPVRRATHLVQAARAAQAHDVACRALAGDPAPGARADLLLVAARTAPPADQLVLVEQASRLLLAHGRVDDVVELLDEVDPQRAATPDERGARHVVEASVAVASGAWTLAGEAIDAGLAAAPSDALVGQLLGLRSVLRIQQFDPAGAREDLATALEVTTTPEVVGRGQMLLAMADLIVGLPGWREALESVLAEARAAGEVVLAQEASLALIYGCGFHGDLDGARDVAADGIDEAIEHRLPVRAEVLRGALAAHEVLAGCDLPRQVDVLRRVVADPRVAVNRSGHRALCAIALADLGALDEARALLAAVDDGPEPVALRRANRRWALAEVELCDLCPEAALTHAEHVVATAAAQPPGVAAAAVAAWARWLLRRPVVEHRGFVPAGMEAPALEVDALAALSRGEPDVAIERFEAAEVASRRYVRRSGLRAMAGRAVALDQAGRPDEAASVRAELVRQASGVGGAGAVALATGQPPTPPDGRDDAPSGLTGRQRQVLELVERGWPTAAISALLGIADATVDAHADAARQRLGAPTRAAAVARRRVEREHPDADERSVLLVGPDEVGLLGDRLALRGWTLCRGAAVASASSELVVLDLVRPEDLRSAWDVLAVDRLVVACVGPGPARPTIVDALARLGVVDDLRGRIPLPDLPAEVLALAVAVAGGVPIAAAAASVDVSRRTAYRRLDDLVERFDAVTQRAAAQRVVRALAVLPAPPTAAT